MQDQPGLGDWSCIETVVPLILVLVDTTPSLPLPFEAGAHLSVTEQIADEHMGDRIGMLIERRLLILIWIGVLEAGLEVPEQVAVWGKDHTQGMGTRSDGDTLPARQFNRRHDRAVIPEWPENLTLAKGPASRRRLVGQPHCQTSAGETQIMRLRRPAMTGLPGSR